MKTSPIIRVLSYAKGHKRMVVLTLFCALTTTVMGFVYPNVTEIMIDRVIRAKEYHLFIPILAAAFGAFLLSDIMNGLRIIFNNTLEQRIAADLRLDLYAKLQKFSVKYFDERSTGQIMTRMQDDVVNLERVLVDGTEQGLVLALQILGVGAMLFLTNWTLALYAMIPMPFLALAVAWYTKRAHKLYSLNAKKRDNLASLLHDNIQGMRQIKTFGREDYEIKRFGERLKQYFQVVLKLMKTWAIYSPLTNFIRSTGLVIILGIGSKYVMDGRMEVGQLVKFLLFLNMFYEPINRLHPLNQLLQSARASGKRVFEILDEKPQIVDQPTAISLFGDLEVGPTTKNPYGRAKGDVRFNDVSFSYNEDKLTLHGIHFTAHAGQTIALVGPTGAGKSTLVNLLPRFHDVTGGQIMIDGRDHREYTLTALRQQIGLVSQEPFLFNGTIRDNVMYGRLDASEEDLSRSLKDANAFDFAMDFTHKLDTVVGERGVKLSVGEKQRLSIARALLKDPPILILDEATASVDTVTEALIQEALHKLMLNRTTFVIAHRLSTIKQADMILVIDDGTIIERGTHTELLALKGKYARLIEVQASI
ncbi:MAG: ABC transporter ATP-binding protein [Verrucomicrobiota bacterium]|nr:ABC transporter ATP-binding protein [Verrucomicrobiota bacterium]